ncbi:swr complex subunit [Mortierella hygrophila]|uniref:SWR1-complex protein 4 n=1 Tax=Mortierella hygrophila TaxID=979708 RepID=A0A9P6F0G8_9FUNG|nr:swr complex subunit [Mortierella hygrophila]
MATGNDVREIFQLKASDQVRRVQKPERKPDGISRELYGLIGNNVSTVAFNNPTYKPKLNVSKKAVNWTWRPFVNPSRDDDLVLQHWEKTRTDPNEEYRFYKFNKSINLISFSPEEYTSHLKDPDWTMEETSYLWDLCRRFDLRWVVIQDRYEWPPQEADRLALQYYNGNNLVISENAPNVTKKEGEDTPMKDASAAASGSGESFVQATLGGDTSTSTGATNAATATASGSNPPTAAASTSKAVVSNTPAKTRSMEDLKHRYYTISRILTKIRMGDASQAVEKAQLLSSMAYDKNREIERKKNLEILNTRTPEQIEEEEALYLEARRIDQNEKKITRERENLLRLLNTRDIYGPGGPTSAGLAGQVGVAGGGGPGTGIIIPSNSITIPSSSSPSASGAAGGAGGSGHSSANGPLSPSVGKGGAGTATPGGASGAASGTTPKKRKKAPKGSVQADDSAPPTPTTATSGANALKGSSSSNHRRPSNASDGPGGPSSASAILPPPAAKKEKLTPGAYLRSQKMTPIVSTKQQRVQSALVTLGLPFKPAMPTATVMAKWDQVQSNIVTLLDIKKQADKLESDLKVVKMRRGSLGSGSSGSSSSLTGSAASGAGGATGGASLGSSVDGNFGVKREGTGDESGTPGPVKKKKRKD